MKKYILMGWGIIIYLVYLVSLVHASDTDRNYLEWLRGLKSTTDRQIIEMEHINRDLAKAFPFLKILDSIIDWTAGIKWIVVEDQRNHEIYDATKISWEHYKWRFRFKKDGDYWFSDDNPDNKKWRQEYNGKGWVIIYDAPDYR